MGVLNTPADGHRRVVRPGHLVRPDERQRLLPTPARARAGQRPLRPPPVQGRALVEHQQGHLMRQLRRQLPGTRTLVQESPRARRWSSRSARHSRSGAAHRASRHRGQGVHGAKRSGVAPVPCLPHGLLRRTDARSIPTLPGALTGPYEPHTSSHDGSDGDRHQRRRGGSRSSSSSRFSVSSSPKSKMAASRDSSLTSQSSLTGNGLHVSRWKSSSYS